MCNQKELLIESKLMDFGGIFCYSWLDLNIFIGERGDEVKWAFFKNYSITFCKILWIAS